MKKKILFLLIFICGMSYPQDTDKKFSLYGAVGYGIGLGGHYFGETQKWEIVNNQESLVAVTDKYMNYGRDFQAQMGAQFLISENLGIQAAFDYTGGRNIIKVEGRSNANRNYEDVYHRHLFGIKTLLVPRFRAFNLFDMYTGVGAGIYWTSLHITSNKTDKRTDHAYYKTKPAMAFNGKIGGIYQFTDIFGMYLEVTLDEMSFTVKSYRNPDDAEEHVLTANSTADDNEPFKIPGSNVGIKLGATVAVF